MTLIPQKPKSKVGEHVNLYIKSDKMSKVFLLGVDKSVRLLEGSSDITKELLTGVLREPMEKSYRKVENDEPLEHGSNQTIVKLNFEQGQKSLWY